MDSLFSRELQPRIPAILKSLVDMIQSFNFLLQKVCMGKGSSQWVGVCLHRKLGYLCLESYRRRWDILLCNFPLQVRVQNYSIFVSLISQVYFQCHTADCLNSTATSLSQKNKEKRKCWSDVSLCKPLLPVYIWTDGLFYKD